MKLLEVGAAVIVNDGKILLTQRDKNRYLGGKWEFPGGKIEAGESREEGLAHADIKAAKILLSRVSKFE